jgi:hypothetical protein
MVSTNFVIRSSITLMIVLCISGCQPVPDVPACTLGEKNFLNDADFSAEAASSRSKHWTGIQHAGEKSFRVTFEGPIAVIEKTGSQPWFLYRQRLKTTQLADVKMAFSAEVKLTPASSGVAVGKMEIPGGLRLSAMGPSGKPILRLESRIPADGEWDDWQFLQVVVQVPKATKALELSFFHESEGTLRVRNPSLREVDATSEHCPLNEPM